MMTEMRMWEDEFSRNTGLLNQEKEIVDGEIEVLKHRLDDLDREIDDQTEKIAMTKAGLQRQEEKLRRVIALVVEKA